MVEVIIVVAIIAILASIIIPKMSGGRDSAALKACGVNLRHIAIAVEMYSNDNNHHYTPWDTSTDHWDYLDYLTPNYLKITPHCPLGNDYRICTRHTSAFRKAPAFATIICCEGSNGVKGHPELIRAGVIDTCPYYWMGGSVQDR